MIKKRNDEWKWMLFVCPALLFFVLFFIVPTIGSFGYSFTKWDGVTSEFIGIKNYIDLFQDGEILTSFSNTIFYTISIVIVQNIIGLALAVLLKKNTPRNNLFRTLVFMPYVFGTLLIGYIFRFILEPNAGALNAALTAIGLENWIRPWLSNPAYARCVVVFVTIWQCCGYTMMINISGLQAIPDDYYEAARIDGASKWKQFIKITLPMLAPSTTVNIMLSLIGDLQIFDQVYAITKGGPGYETESIAMTVYRLGFGTGGATWGYGAAMSVVMFFIMMIITVVFTTLLRKREVDI